MLTFRAEVSGGGDAGIVTKINEKIGSTLLFFCNFSEDLMSCFFVSVCACKKQQAINNDLLVLLTISERDKFVSLTRLFFVICANQFF